MHEAIVILAAGVSSRMKKSQAEGGVSDQLADEANQRTKGMIRVGEKGQPLLDYLLWNIRESGYRRVYFVTGADNQLMKEHYGTADSGNDFHGLKISYAIQSIPEGRTKPMGTADAVFQALDQYPELQRESFTVCNSDNLYSVKAFKLLQNIPSPNGWVDYDRDGFDFPPERVRAFAVTLTDSDQYLMDIIEKPGDRDVEKCRNADGTVRVSMNLFKFDGGLFYGYLKNCPVNPVRKEKELPTALLNMVADHPGSTQGTPHSEHVPDLTEKKDILTVQTWLEKEYGAFSWE